MRTPICVLLCVLLPGLALANDFVCEDTVTVGKYRRYLYSIDPTSVVLQPNELCHNIPDAEVLAQQAACFDGHTPPPTIPRKYRSVQNQLFAEMSQAEKDVVDAAEAAVAAQNEAYATERTDSANLCSEKQLATITDKLAQRKTTNLDQRLAALNAINAKIDAAAGLNQAFKDLLKEITAFVNEGLVEDINDNYPLFDKTARCIRSQVGLRQ